VADTRDIRRDGLFSTSYLPDNLGSGKHTGRIDPETNVAHPVSPNTKVAYSGADIFAFITSYGINIAQNSPLIPLKNLLAMSYSVHREKMPVRRLGSEVAHDYTLGTKTIAGSLVLLNFDRTALSELILGSDIYGDSTIVSTYDDIPPFDITLMFQEEIQGSYGTTFSKEKTAGNNRVSHGENVQYSVLKINGIRLVDEGMVVGTDEAYLETTFQYVAESVEPLDPVVINTRNIQLAGQILDADQLGTVDGIWYKGKDKFTYVIEELPPIADLPRINPHDGIQRGGLNLLTATDDLALITSGAPASWINMPELPIVPIVFNLADNTSQFDWKNGGIDLSSFGSVLTQGATYGWEGSASGKWPIKPMDHHYIGKVVFPVTPDEAQELFDSGNGSLVDEKLIFIPRTVDTQDSSKDAESRAEQKNNTLDMCRTYFASKCLAAFDATGKIFSHCVDPDRIVDT